MTRSNPEISRWLLGLEALVCFGPLTLLWIAASQLALSRYGFEPKFVLPAIIGILGPLALSLTLYRLLGQRRSASNSGFVILALSFGVVSALQLVNTDATWFGFDWRVWMLSSVLPSLACAQFALFGTPNLSLATTRG